MVHFLKKYKAFGLGFIIVLIAILLMHYYKFLLIPDDAPIEIFFVFTFWWLLISLPIYKFSYIKKKRKVLYKLITLFVLFIGTLIIDSRMKMPDNPITFILLMGFWIGFAYLLVPIFVIVPVLVIVRVFNNYLEHIKTINKH